MACQRILQITTQMNNAVTRKKQSLSKLPDMKELAATTKYNILLLMLKTSPRMTTTVAMETIENTSANVSSICAFIQPIPRNSIE